MFDIKQYSWIPVYGFVVGFCSRRIFENAYGFIPISEYSVFDLQSVTYGVIFMMLTAIMTGGVAYSERVLGRFARIKYSCARDGKFKKLKTAKVFLFLCFVSAKMSFAIHFALALLVLWITDNFPLAIFVLFISIMIWPVLAFASKDDSNKADDAADEILKFLKLDSVLGIVYTALAMAAIALGFFMIRTVPQSFGGARSQIVILHIRESNITDSLLLNKINKKPIILLYNQNSVIWIKERLDSTKLAINKSDIAAIENLYVKPK